MKVQTCSAGVGILQSIFSGSRSGFLVLFPGVPLFCDGISIAVSARNHQVDPVVV